MTGSGGKRVGRYRLQRRLGSGAMGSVWLAEDENLGLQVAIKQIDVPRDVEDGDLEQRVSRARAEARNAAQLRGHPHVVNVLDIVEEDGLPWIVMEYVTGASDLRAVIREQGRLSDADIARVGIAVLKALSAGHSLGIVHRDVKPSNILLAPDHSGNRHGRVMLTDYGISLYPGSGQTRMTNGVIGTPGYMAPERAQGAEPPASDLFSLGATLYCASEGRGPFDRDTAAAAVAAALTEEPARPVSACGPLADVIMGLLAKEPGHRSTAHNAITELAAVEAAARVAAGSTGGVGGGTTHRSLPRPSRKVLAGMAAGAVALAVTVLTTLALADDSPKSDAADPPARKAGSTGGPGPGATRPSGDDSGSPRPGVLYGTEAGLREPLKAGDCVIVGTHNEDYTTLTDVVIVDCVETDTSPTPAGQVIATVPDEGEASVRRECGEQTAELRESLADPVLTVLRPGGGGARGARDEAACLVFQRGISAGGALGKYREPGSFVYLSQLSVGDCFDEKDDDIFLTDCDKPHHEQVIGHVEVPGEVSHEDVDNYAICANRFREDWVRGDREDVNGWTNSGDWEDGFQIVTCTLEGTRESRLPAGVATPRN